MKISKVRLTCKCGHVFDADVVTDAPIAVAVASMKAASCPQCGNQKHLGMGGELGGKPKVSDLLSIRMNWWFNSGDTGISSLTIYGVFAGRPHERPDTPHDPSDFGRCRRLFDLMPEWRANIGAVRNFYPWFGPFIDRWDEMDALWDEEAPKKKCPKLYRAMQIARVESLRLRHPKANIETDADGALRYMSE